MTADTDGPAKGGASAQPRRLTSVVAIDAAGYSRQSEIDEAVAVREITALSERIHASAESHGGRVFNTAGDGFMLEFPAATAAVAAAEELQAVDRVPMRIGVHVGEVHETPNGDLLGKGVNVAARLMQMADPGSIVISEDAKRAISADVAARLQRRGQVQLDKMSERIEVYELGSPWRARRFKLPRGAPWIAAAAAAVLLVVGWVAVQMLRPAQAQSIAVLEFRALEPALTPFAVGLADRIIGTMSAHDLQPAHSTATADEDRIAAATATGAPFVLDGTVRNDNADRLVSARLMDVRGNVVVWSREYRRVANEENYMQEQIAADVARILRCALVSWRTNGRIDSSTMYLFLRACDGHEDPQQALALARQVTEQAPRFSRGWSMRGLLAANMSQWNAPELESAALAEEARDAAARARRLDPGNGESYLAELALLPIRDWQGRRQLIDRALEADPDLAAAHAALAYFYMGVGRNRDALAPLQRAARLEPLNPEFWSVMTPPLRANGRHREAQELRERQYRVWPDSTPAWLNRFFNSVFVDDSAEALRMLDNIEASPVASWFEPRVVLLWRNFVSARRSGDRNRIRAAARGLLELSRTGWRDASGAALSFAGEVDAAFEIIRPWAQNPRASTHTFWHSPWTNLRHDPRFIDMIAETGLIQYWRETEWPDFCSEPDLPYDCEREAARVAPQ